MTHDLSSCRICGDKSTTDPVTWQATGLCVACDTPAVLAGSTRRKRKEWQDREVHNPTRASIFEGKTAGRFDPDA